MSRNAVETVMGGVVLLVAGGFLAFAYNSASIKETSGYEVKAKFDNVAGIAGGSDVRVGGIKIGSVTGQNLDPATFSAVLTFNIKNDIKLPTDSTAAISSDGLLGGKYVSISPGGDEKNLANGDEIKYTQSSVNIEELIGKMVFSGGGVDNKKKDSAPANSAPPAEGETQVN